MQGTSSRLPLGMQHAEDQQWCVQRFCSLPDAPSPGLDSPVGSHWQLPDGDFLLAWQSCGDSPVAAQKARILCADRTKCLMQAAGAKTTTRT